MTVNFDSIINELKAQTEVRKKRELEDSPRGQLLKKQFSEIQRNSQRLESAQEQLRNRYFSTQRDRQAAVKALKQEFEALQKDIANAGTAEAESILADIDETLLDTLERDDYFDLHSLKKQGVHPEFTSQYGKPTPQSKPISAGPQPELSAVPEPGGLSKIFGGKVRYERALAEARSAHEEALKLWKTENSKIPTRQLEQMQKYQSQEASRLESLGAERYAYDEAKAIYDKELSSHNDAVNAFEVDYQAGTESAVGTYLNLVFASSLYPTNLPLQIWHEFLGESREARVKVSLPDPSVMPSVKGYRYVKAKDEVLEIPVTEKEARDRYLNLVQNLSLRILHEIWESDRPRHIETVSLSGWVDHVDRATGQDTHTQVVAVAVDRKTFEGIDLRRATPGESLKYLGAVVSKNPHGYVPIVDQYGVRGR